MPVNGTVSSPVDVRLPLTPEQVDDPKTFRELTIVYQAIRSLQSALAGTQAGAVAQDRIYAANCLLYGVYL